MKEARDWDQYLWLLPSAKVIAGDSLHILVNGSKITLFEGGGKYECIARELEGETPERTVRELLYDGYEVIRALDEYGLLVRLRYPLSETIKKHPTRSRQLSYFAHLQRNMPDLAFDELGTRRVLIVGCGGVGSHTAYALAGAGVRRMVLMDPDVVEESNLNRQFFYRQEDLGCPKVTVATQFLMQRHQDLEIDPHITTFSSADTESDWFDEVDLVIFSGDSPTLDDRTVQGMATKPFIIGGYRGTTALVGPICAPELGSTCFCCLYSPSLRAGSDWNEAAVRSHGWQPSATPMNSIVGGLVAEASARFLATTLESPILVGEQLAFSMPTLEVTTLEFPPCPHSQIRLSV